MSTASSSKLEKEDCREGKLAKPPEKSKRLGELGTLGEKSEKTTNVLHWEEKNKA